jgi:hypothetical protein
MQKFCHLSSLQDGSPFLFRSGSNEYVCMYLVRAGDSTCKVQGFKKTEAGNYSAFADFFSPATEVYYDANRKQLTINKNGLLSIPREEWETFGVGSENKKEKKEDKPKGGARGRPKKHKLDLPVGKEMTTSQMAEQLGVKKFVVSNEIAKIKKQTPSRILELNSVLNKKGKPAKVFKILF